MNNAKLKIFQEQSVRTHWDDKQEKWFFSIVDVIGILTGQINHQGARNYWKVLKKRLLKEGNETVTNCNRLKMLAADGKMRMTDVADTEQLLRLIQSVPSPKAEPFKRWLAKPQQQKLPEIKMLRGFSKTKMLQNKVEA
ncbi:MAG: Bro-N domain-containing protein [Bacteroidales bacterium]|nr:Bro-N domain-containing protein [Bacteroidales bacterium]